MYVLILKYHISATWKVLPIIFEWSIRTMWFKLCTEMHYAMCKEWAGATVAERQRRPRKVHFHSTKHKSSNKAEEF